MTLWAHTIVKNEDRYLWYSVNSVINFVDKILLWDTGSTDRTLDIIRELQKNYPSKIDYKEMGDVNVDQFTTVRQKMLDETRSDWVIIVDGDEVWWDEKIKEVRSVIETRGKDLDSIVAKYYNIVGDIYHYQDESAGRYNIDGKVGNYNIRAFNRKIKGIRFTRPHGQQALVDDKNVLLQDRDYRKKYWIEGYSHLHFTNMQRSGKRTDDLKVPKRSFKLKYDLGNIFPPDFYYPEVFFQEQSDAMQNIWLKTGIRYYLRALIETPIKNIRRKYFLFGRSGY